MLWFRRLPPITLTICCCSFLTAIVSCQVKLNATKVSFSQSTLYCVVQWSRTNVWPMPMILYSTHYAELFDNNSWREISNKNSNCYDRIFIHFTRCDVISFNLGNDSSSTEDAWMSKKTFNIHFTISAYMLTVHYYYIGYAAKTLTASSPATTT